MNHNDEILDVVSEKDEVIKQEYRNTIYEQKLFFRVINGFICNSKKELWIPRRHPHKKLFPSALDCSVGGHVSSGEDYDSAFKRETLEELNINVETMHIKKIAYLTPLQHGTSAFMWIYIIYSDAIPSFNQDDFVEHQWLTPDEIIERLHQGECAKSDLLPIITYIKDIL